MAERDDELDQASEAEDGDRGALYDPSELEATRMREQGLGMGAEDLALQRDPTGATTTEAFRESTGTRAEDEAEEAHRGSPAGDRRH